MKKLKLGTFSPYWHLEIIIAIPLIIYFVWRIETVVHVLNIIAKMK